MTYDAGSYDCIVIGAGHAGCEAALAAARLGCKTLITTLNVDNIAQMPCNPSIGGPAKGHLVREIDALGGEMGRNIDETFIQIKLLNTGKGPAVHALRAQADKYQYQKRMTQVLQEQKNLDIKQTLVDRVLVNDKGQVEGIETETGAVMKSPTVIVCTGTYLRGRIIIGDVIYPGGPNGQRAAVKLSQSLKEIGIELGRFKTGTPSRVDRSSIDFGKMSEQPGDDNPQYFSFMTEPIRKSNIPCYLAYTNEETHEVIRQNLHRSPLYSGTIEGVGPRYCPSFESKVVRFADKDRHQLFIEPEGLDTSEMYVQGMSSSLPEEVQIQFLRTIKGMENVEVIRIGYAIEYDYVNPTQLLPSLEVKQISGLFCAGQTNGSSGYEEAAAQGLIAGINAARKVVHKEPFIIKRSEAYIGVLIDDLVTKGTNEPYRLMTSRAEYRLLLRQDNADLRLTEKGWEIGLVTPLRYERFRNKKAQIEEEFKRLKETIVTQANCEIDLLIEKTNSTPLKQGITLYELLRRSEIEYEDLLSVGLGKTLPKEITEQIEIQIKYEGYIAKQLAQIERFEKLENKVIPDDLDYTLITSISVEAKEKLQEMRPKSIGQASRISGVSPADVSVLLIYMEQQRRRRNEDE